MAAPPIKTKRKPQYSGAVVCHKCDAEFKPGNWYRVTDISTGTKPPEYANPRKIPDGECPMCRTKYEELTV